MLRRQAKPRRLEVGAKHRTEWRKARLVRSVAASLMRPRVKMIIKELDYKKYKGQKYQAEILSDRYLSIESEGQGFAIKWVMSGEPLRMMLNEDLLSDWLEDPVAYGAFEGDELIGMVVEPGWWCSKLKPLTLRQFHFIKNTDLRLSALTGMPTPTAGRKNITCAWKWGRCCERAL